MTDTMKPTLPLEEWFSHETVQRLIDEAYASGLEDAAKSCEVVTEWCTDATGCRYKTTAYDAQRCIAAISSLKPSKQRKAGI